MIQAKKLIGVFVIAITFAFATANAEQTQTATNTVTVTSQQVMQLATEVAAGRVTSATAGAAMVGGNQAIAASVMTAVKQLTDKGLTPSQASIAFSRFRMALPATTSGEEAVARLAQVANSGVDFSKVTVAELKKALAVPAPKANSAVAATTTDSPEGLVLSFPSTDAAVQAKQASDRKAVEAGSEATRATLAQVSDLLKKAQAADKVCPANQGAQCVSEATEGVMTAYAAGLYNVGGEAAIGFADAAISGTWEGPKYAYMRGYNAAAHKYAAGTLDGHLRTCMVTGK